MIFYSNFENQDEILNLEETLTLKRNSFIKVTGGTYHKIGFVCYIPIFHIFADCDFILSNSELEINNNTVTVDLMAG